MEEGERKETPNRGNPVDGLWRRQRAIAVLEKLNSKLRLGHTCLMLAISFTLLQSTNVMVVYATLRQFLKSLFLHFCMEQ